MKEGERVSREYVRLKYTIVPYDDFYNPQALDKNRKKKKRLIEMNQIHVWKWKRFSTFSGSVSGKKGKTLPLFKASQNRKN